MSTRKILPFAGTIVILAVFIFVFVHDGNDMNVSGSSYTSPSPVTSDEKIPLSYALPSGWKANREQVKINTIVGGGPMEVLWLESPYPNLNIPELSEVFIQFSWFPFNPDAALEDIVPLLYAHADDVPSFENLILHNNPAVRIITYGNADAVIDGDQPAYRVENYLMRLDPQTLFRIEVLYDTEEALLRAQNDVQIIINSIRFEE